MFLYLGHLVGVARHLTGVVPYPLVFLRDTGVMNSGQSRITPQKEEKCIQNPQKTVIYTWSRPYPDDIKVYSTLVAGLQVGLHPDTPVN